MGVRFVLLMSVGAIAIATPALADGVYGERPSPVADFDGGYGSPRIEPYAAPRVVEPDYAPPRLYRDPYAPRPGVYRDYPPQAYRPAPVYEPRYVEPPAYEPAPVYGSGEGYGPGCRTITIEHDGGPVRRIRRCD